MEKSENIKMSLPIIKIRFIFKVSFTSENKELNNSWENKIVLRANTNYEYNDTYDFHYNCWLDDIVEDFNTFLFEVVEKVEIEENFYHIKLKPKF